MMVVAIIAFSIGLTFGTLKCESKECPECIQGDKSEDIKRNRNELEKRKESYAKLHDAS